MTRELEQEPTTKNNLRVDKFDKAINQSDLEEWIMETFSDWCEGDVRLSMNHMDEMPSVTLQEPKWIPVSERLPDTDDKVLCWYEYFHWSQKKVLPEYGLGYYFRETSAWFGEVAHGKDVRVIAWMPLPKPYKVESEGT